MYYRNQFSVSFFIVSVCKNQLGFEWPANQKADFWNLDLFLLTDTMREEETFKVDTSLLSKQMTWTFIM